MNRALAGPLASLLALTLVAISCTTPGTKPQDMTTTGHTGAATEHAAESAAHAKLYDEDASAQRRVFLGTDIACPTAPISVGASSRCYTTETYNPTTHHLASAERHQAMAQKHAAAGAELAAYEEGACKLFEPHTRASCPLLGQLASATAVENGVRLTVRSGVNVQAWQAHIACHIAFAQARGATDAAVCPLTQRGVKARIDGEAIELTTSDATAAEKLLALARNHLE